MHLDLAFVALLSACTGASTEPEVPPPPEIHIGDEAGWVREVARDPAAYAAVVSSNPTGWAAMQANDYRRAVTAFDAAGTNDAWVGRGRAELALAVVYEDVAAASAAAHEDLYRTWSDRNQLPAGTEAPLVAALAAHCYGAETAASWAHRVTSGPDAPMAAAITQGGAALEVMSPGPFGQRAALHRRARATGDVDLLAAAALQPVAKVEEKKTTRVYFDPCIWATLSDLWLSKAIRDLASASGPLAELPLVDQRSNRGQWRRMERLHTADAGLATRLFAPWPSAADLRAELASTTDPGLLGARAPSLRTIGLGTVAPGSDDPQTARDETARLDAALAKVQRAIATLPTGADTLQLRLIERYRQEQLAVRARSALDRGNPQQALAYLTAARAGTQGIGPDNGPAVFTLLLRAQVELGQGQEALDTLRIVSERFPDVLGLEQTVTDWAVLHGAVVTPSQPKGAP